MPSPTSDQTHLSRRALLACGAASVSTLGLSAPAKARVAAGANIDYVYEVTKSDAEWRAQLSEREYEILREGYTEGQRTGTLWEEKREGSYHCKGCELKVFDGRWKTFVEGKGWVFFIHPEPASVMTNIDGPTPEYGAMGTGKTPLTEIHCRRCGCHLGHYLLVEGKMTHCINGTSLTFQPASA
ncbi:peptide-methionine (R)-S-oxide reductase [Litoreibacter ponti]|uniref:peptide-methionine (R)-S-oxide reductase n=1 Tax=Litoreibacter ponti TaxID=1510457 RepID=A0A2T6BKA0_9RHOB|nr:peptide-methionine (R)-S-oxide reductase [Litoreibacter ponti]PTX56500.1 peptide-methionine (R)-S-oxide reductase [Litoreibacter ponti]